MTVAQRLVEQSFETLTLAFEESVLTVMIDRPEVLNALSPVVIAELRLVFGELRDALGHATEDAAAEPDWSVRGVLLTGSGAKSFVAGADISAMQHMTPEESRLYSAQTQELTVIIETLAVPVVAAVNGFALGGGCELAMACDYIFASENASFGQPEVGLGLIPGFGGTVRLAQYVGIAAAREMVLTGRRIDAAEALQLGLALRVLPTVDELREAARASLLLAARNSPAAVSSAKQTIREARHLSTDAGLGVELDAFAARFGTPDMVEGTSAFLEKRRPHFSGR
ncbi:MAG: enoyl-CoA hydratase [Leucobacter sp.]|nr:enoyl-CoA hydratase [Leucobacter sp.]